MELSPIEKNKQENIDLLQIEYFSDLPISKKDIVVIEPNNAIAITARKFLTNLGFENIYICKEVNEGLKIFVHFIEKDTTIPIIIDDASINNIENAVMSILEIQPSSKIIVMTTKEKTNPQILRLFELGVSSLVHKPLIFDDFRNAFASILDKNGNFLGSEITKNFETLLATFSRISDNKIKDILKIDQTQSEKIIKNAIENKKMVFNNEILEATCNQCDSTDITLTSECPRCNGRNFEQKGLIEHYSCGEVYPKETNYGTCPKCNKQIGSVGKDYREFTEYYVCSSCNEHFPRPLFKFVCFDCNNTFIEKLANWKKGKVYQIQK